VTTLYITLYKDLKYVGYDALKYGIENWLKIAKKTLQHNVQAMRSTLEEFGKENITRGTILDWKHAARHLDLPKSVKNATLWMDSSDFKVWSKGGFSRKDEFFSRKENSLARKFQFVNDGRGRIVDLFGPYSPKTHDSEFLKLQKDLIANAYTGAEILADGHYTVGRTLVDNILFHVALTKGETRYPPKYNQMIRKFNITSKEYSKHIRKARAFVESPFGLLKLKYKSLANKFTEGERELQKLVFYSVGLYNLEL
jgi:hypothetical protein